MPNHPRLAALLNEAAIKFGSQSALARALGVHHTAVGAIIAGKRFVTKKQSVMIEKLLGLPARELWLEAMAHEFDERLARDRSKK